eukprot:CAMPEP_0176117696 /NCGR_PEP_ID=MMETSP0120_2-20121206/59132_1 /TAXON_ID=160619 /ORGANISM="Kryptoperidinium foliaceum, Strain CCMP 1326" /LENGTH=63 /DNA_ID=CAMNT_0017451997 /DNA_START=145 /DNA_END=333 /DNA_ORIENTATION=-
MAPRYRQRFAGRVRPAVVLYFLASCICAAHVASPPPRGAAARVPAALFAAASASSCGIEPLEA